MAIAERIVQNQNNEEMLRRALERIVQLYTDKAHFVYELLQNAEDAGATKISFKQYADRLEVLHDGHPFTEENLAGLCDIGKSDKVNNLNQIGEFGVGFKSVFGICETVKLYSHPAANDTQYEKFAVEIINFTHPVDIEDIEIESNYTTKFVFPYCAGKSFSGFATVQKLNEKLSQRLQNLGITTLLFMKNLKYIDYEIQLNTLNTKGCYLLDKQEINDHCAMVSALGESESESDNVSYLIFSKKIDTQQVNRSVDIAFALNVDEHGDYNFIPAKHPYISVYFPTETESKLKFIVQGPYRTTPNRSSIPMDDRDNENLAFITASLLKESILEIKSWNKLNMSLINILPVNWEAFENAPLFECLYNTVVEMVKQEEILPCIDGNYASIYDAKISRGKEFANVITSNLLTELIDDGNEYHWLPTYLTETNTEYKELYDFLVDEMDIDVFRPEHMRDYFNENSKFLESRSDKWLVEFYNMYTDVKGAFSKDRYGTNMLTAKIVKADTGKFVAPYRVLDKWSRTESKYIPNIFIPPAKGIAIRDVLFVDQDLLSACPEFFNDILGLEEPNEYEFFMKAFLAHCDDKNYSEEVRLADLKILIKYSVDERYSTEIKKTIKDKVQLRCKSESGHNYRYVGKESIYFSTTDEGLSIEHYYQNIRRINVVDEQYYLENGISRESLGKCGVINDIATGRNATRGEYETYSPGRNPEWHTSGDFRWCLDLKDIVNVLDYIITNPEEPDSYIKSSFIFKFLLLNETKLVGTAYIGGNHSNIYDAKSTILDHLASDRKWLFNDALELVSAEEISKRELSQMLYGNLVKNSTIYEILGFKRTLEDDLDDAEEEYGGLSKDRQEQFAELYLREKYGLSLSDIEGSYSKATPNDISSEEESNYEFPVSEIRNMASLKKHVAEVLYFAQPVRYEKVVRSIRTSSNANASKDYLRGMYKVEGTSRYACQMCHDVFPNYVSCQIEAHPEDEISANNLCLCPNCATKYKLTRNNEQQMVEFFDDIIKLTDSELRTSPVELYLNNEKIWFTQTHIAEVREYLLLKHAMLAEQTVDSSGNTGDSKREEKSTEDIVEPVREAKEPIPTNEIVGKRIFHNIQKKTGTIVLFEDGKIGIAFDGAPEGKISKYSLEMCIEKKLIAFEE